MRGEERECYTRSNRPGAATQGRQQPGVGHKSSMERPTRQGESSRHSGAAAEGATGAGYPEGDKQRPKGGGRRGGLGGHGLGVSRPRTASSYQQGWAPAGVGISLAAGGAGWQAHSRPGPARSPREQQLRAWCALPGGHPSPGTPVWAAAHRRRNHSAPGACQPQPQPAPVRATPAWHMGGAGGSSAGSQARQQLAGGREG